MSHLLKSFALLLVACLQAQNAVEACHNPQHVRPTPKLAISGRKKRNILGENATTTQDADAELSEFFTACLLKKTGPIFGSWRSVVDFVIRDTYWFEATDVDYCSGYKDSAKCWTRRLPFLFKAESILLTPTSDCIYDYDQTVKKERGLEFELYYKEFFDAFDYEPSFGEFGQWNREELEDVLSAAQSFFPTKFEIPSPASFTGIGQTLPPLFGKSCSFFDKDYVICIATEVAELTKSASVMDKFPSLVFFDMTSNAQFVMNHYSSCRITKEQKGDSVAYIENCAANATQDNDDEPDQSPITNLFSKIIPPIFVPQILTIDEIKSLILPITPCLVNALSEIVKNTSPIYPPVVECRQQLPERPAGKGRIGRCRDGDHWTRWMNIDSPDGEGDMETLQVLRKTYRGQICQNPTAVDARALPKNVFFSATEDLVYLSLHDGLRCLNSEQEQRNCSDFKLRFCCSVEPPQCNETNQWTPWLSDYKRKRSGDFEYLPEHIEKHGVCSNPLAIQARISKTKKHYLKSFNVIDIAPDTGLACNQTEQRGRRCRDFEVSFCCPK